MLETNVLQVLLEMGKWVILNLRTIACVWDMAGNEKLETIIDRSDWQVRN